MDESYKMDEEGTIKQKVLDAAEKHPYVLLGAVVVLIIVILMMYFNIFGLGNGSSKKERMKKDSSDGDEMDELIKSIHDKQNKNKK